MNKNSLKAAKAIVSQCRWMMLGVDLLNKEWPVEYDARLTEVIAKAIDGEVKKVMEKCRMLAADELISAEARLQKIEKYAERFWK